MAGFSNYAEAAILDHIFGNTTFTPPSTFYIALFTTAPDFETGTGGTEVSGGSYARASVTNNTTNFPNSSGGSKSNGTDILFPTPTASWGTVVAWGVYDASSGGNFFGGQLQTPNRPVSTGETIKFNTGVLAITLD